MLFLVLDLVLVLMLELLSGSVLLFVLVFYLSVLGLDLVFVFC